MDMPWRNDTQQAKGETKEARSSKRVTMAFFTVITRIVRSRSNVTRDLEPRDAPDCFLIEK